MLNAAQLALNREEITTGTNSTSNRSADQLRGNGEPTATTKAARTSHGTALNTGIHDAGDQQATSCHPNAVTSNMEASKECAIPARRRSGVGLLHKVHLVEILHAHARHGMRRQLGHSRHRRQC